MCWEASSITVFEKFLRYWEQKINNFVEVLVKKTAHAQQGYHTRKSRKTLYGETVYGESSVKVSR